jgi:hypothetical protein
LLSLARPAYYKQATPYGVLAGAVTGLGWQKMVVRCILLLLFDRNELRQPV